MIMWRKEKESFGVQRREKAKLSQPEKNENKINLNHGNCTHLFMRLLSGYFHSLITIKPLLSYHILFYLRT